MRYIKSDKLIYIKGDKKNYLYHKYFGNLCLITDETLNVLNSLDNTEISKLDEKIVEKLLDNYFIHEEDFNEDNYFEAEKIYRTQNLDSGYLVRGIQLILSNDCNFNCAYCFEDTNNCMDRKKLVKKDMPFHIADKAIEKAINNVKSNGNNNLTIEFFGGEPLLNWSTIKQVFDKYEDGKKYDIQLFYTITTNSALLNIEMLDYFEKYGCNLIISFDSPTNKERVHKDGRSVMDVVLPKLEMLSNRNINIAFNSVISQTTLRDYNNRELVNLADKYNIKNIGLILDLDANYYNTSYDTKQVQDLLIDTYCYAREKGINVTGYWEKIYSQIIGNEPLYLLSGYKTCPATGCKLSIEPNGEVYICKCCVQKVGDIEDYDNIYKSDIYKNYSNRIYKNSDSCADCELDKFCSGVCMGSAEKKVGSIFYKENILCSLYKNITKNLILSTPDDLLEVI
ncbi:radical SAM/SPASM domain-containing protein [Maledivibacter halophilus]|uniref:Radical SAM core domain-containing protein n=1 Tax=Maledivibacter halophilus TaxID=36842 RepID=A0A1T5L007_9FIRM|nr:radical SAM protein [Maledivibacter halophilus]SKC69367.1 uncharacterized protein SAMN02194393_02244 [Maledivibacter halophilus]